MHHKNFTSMENIVNLTRNWSIFRTVSKVLIRSLIFLVVAPASLRSPSCLLAPPTHCNSLSRYVCLTYVLSCLVWGYGHWPYLLPASIRYGLQWLTGMVGATLIRIQYTHTHTQGEAVEVNTDTWSFTMNCQQLLIQRARFSVGRPIQQIPVAGS